MDSVDPESLGGIQASLLARHNLLRLRRFFFWRKLGAKGEVMTTLTANDSSILCILGEYPNMQPEKALELIAELSDNASGIGRAITGDPDVTDDEKTAAEGILRWAEENRQWARARKARCAR